MKLPCVKRQTFLYIAVITTMTVLFVTLLTLSILGATSKEKIAASRDKNLELKLVHVVSKIHLLKRSCRLIELQFFRHGARTPDSTYPLDPHVNETFEPFGLGQLTNVSSIVCCTTRMIRQLIKRLKLFLFFKTGKQQMFELGEFLRDRYDEFLGKQLRLDASQRNTS